MKTIEKIIPYMRTKISLAKRKRARARQGEDLERLATAYLSYKPALLHFGCGSRVLKGWINIDIYREENGVGEKGYGAHYHPEMRGTAGDFFGINIMETGLPLPDNSVDAVFHEDFFEHLDQKEQALFLAETLRVLKPGGVHRINTPNLASSMRDHSDFSRGKAGVYAGEWERHGHKSVMTPASLREIALMVGYRDAVFNGRDRSISKFVPSEFRPGPDRPEDGNIFADLIK